MEKKVDGYSTRYVYDGDHIIAEYDGNNNLLRKYIYGPGIDQPVSMIEVADGNAAYYYHFDALGSVVALSDAAGDTVQTYEYSVYGEVAVEDANHTNPYMSAARRFDIEIGLYYNRARYYNPFTGRFLQTDPIGYDDGMNWYAYCANNPLVFVDLSGLWAYYGGDFTPSVALPEGDLPDISVVGTPDVQVPDTSDTPDGQASALLGGITGATSIALTFAAVPGTPDHSTADDGLLEYGKITQGWEFRVRPPKPSCWRRFWNALAVRRKVSHAALKNLANHLFGTPEDLLRHKLAPLLKSFGGDQLQATKAIYGAAQSLLTSGLAQTLRDGTIVGPVLVNGMVVEVRGMLVDGVLRVSRASMPSWVYGP